MAPNIKLQPMKNKMKLFPAIIGLVCGALCYWFNPYNEMYVLGIDIYYLMATLAFLSMAAFRYVHKKHELSTPVFFCIGFVISVLGRIFFDISNDPSSHNMFPFEVAFVLVIIVPSTILGSYLMGLANKKIWPIAS